MRLYANTTVAEKVLLAPNRREAPPGIGFLLLQSRQPDLRLFKTLRLRGSNLHVEYRIDGDRRF